MRVTEYVLPFVSLVPGGSANRMGTMFISVPMDNTSHMLFWGLWDEDGSPAYLASEQGLRRGARDIDNYASDVFRPRRHMGANRAAMSEGHFTGFDGSLLDEDMVVQASMGPIVDRAKEHLCASDVGIINARRRLLEELEAMQRGQTHPWCSDKVRPLDIVANADFVWRDVSPTGG